MPQDMPNFSHELCNRREALPSEFTMTYYREVVNDHGTFRGMYDPSEDTLDIIESPSFENASKLSLRRILHCLSPRSHRVIRGPGIHKFRVWLNKKPILSSPESLDSESHFIDEASDSCHYEPFRTVPLPRRNKHRTKITEYSHSLRQTVRQWFHHDLTSQNQTSKNYHHLDESTMDSAYSNSTLADGLVDYKTKRQTYSPTQTFDGPTALM
ncbi:uncharacterized protein KLLA0_E18327g [Kluyveromyces lactis]|uniref:KLLA0E18327p n=1 Tax=Kluyveromyces lactis (strain ATCC 8585 / CBS 2359 / DSM 70799 / NBRC 1267 / NRRL Y-1140 / WM37) TaxID=284590 RepID=Q6CMR2_KLULA|nr:uncharacterized protein KLLA0_E18327g [Kluyveromyces lactis]CAG99864.1 KLLA0E18327p [Kluyveromyces lactis]|eukprot:XP_454777.1 uncharacterized protein KLLA0_E18327g [Kluyveromyces lactis]